MSMRGRLPTVRSSKRSSRSGLNAPPGGCDQCLGTPPTILSVCRRHRRQPFARSVLLSIEDHGRLMPIPIFETFLSKLSTVPRPDLAHVVRIARACEQRIAADDVARPTEVE